MKINILVQMFVEVIKRKITVDYILMNSWFISLDLLKKCEVCLVQIIL